MKNNSSSKYTMLLQEIIKKYSSAKDDNAKSEAMNDLVSTFKEVSTLAYTNDTLYGVQGEFEEFVKWLKEKNIYKQIVEKSHKNQHEL